MKNKIGLGTILFIVCSFVLESLIVNIMGQHNMPNEIIAATSSLMPMLLIFGFMLYLGIKEKTALKYKVLMIMIVTVFLGVSLLEIGEVSILAHYAFAIPSIVGLMIVMKKVFLKQGFTKEFEKQLTIPFRVFLIASCVGFSIFFSVMVVNTTKDLIEGPKIKILRDCEVRNNSDHMKKGVGVDTDYLVGTDESGTEYKLKILDIDGNAIRGIDVVEVKFWENLKIVIDVEALKDE